MAIAVCWSRWIGKPAQAEGRNRAPLLLPVMLSKLRKAAENKGFILPFKQGVRGSNPRWSTKEKSLEMLEFQVFPGFFAAFWRRGRACKSGHKWAEKDIICCQNCCQERR